MLEQNKPKGTHLCDFGQHSPYLGQEKVFLSYTHSFSATLNSALVLLSLL